MRIKALLKDVFYLFLNLLLPFKEDRAVILMYHSIGNEGEFFQVTKAEFSRQMAYLSQNDFKVVGLSKLLADTRSGVHFFKKTVAVTFDDGYLDNYSVAWPILRHYHFPATIFINTADLGGERVARGGHKLPLMSEREILELRASGLIDFGSHCHQHVKLVNLSAEAMSDEFSQSKKILKNLLGQEANILAYPTGRYNEQVQAEAKKYFNWAVSVKSGLVGRDDDAMAIKRNSVDRAVSFNQFKGLVKFGKI